MLEVLKEMELRQELQHLDVLEMIDVLELMRVLEVLEVLRMLEVLMKLGMHKLLVVLELLELEASSLELDDGASSSRRFWVLDVLECLGL